MRERIIPAKVTQLQSKTLSPFEVLEKSGLIGCIQEGESLSKNYKKIIADSLINKHGLSKNVQTERNKK